jgi:hypothetical protein
MPRGKGIYDDEGADEPNGPTGQGRDDGTTTQENTPDVAETDQEPTG